MRACPASHHRARRDVGVARLTISPPPVAALTLTLHPSPRVSRRLRPPRGVAPRLRRSRPWRRAAPSTAVGLLGTKGW